MTLIGGGQQSQRCLLMRDEVASRGPTKVDSMRQHNLRMRAVFCSLAHNY